MSRRFVWLTIGVFLIIASATSAQEKTAEQGATRFALLFKFHSSFWVNLHQALFHEALLRMGKLDRRLQSNAPLISPQMGEREKAEWDAVVDFYAKTFGTRQEVFDDEMVNINNLLAQQLDDGGSLDASSLPLAINEDLRNAAPIYRKYWWPAHDASNQLWISSQARLVKEIGPEIAAGVQKDLHQQWPAAPIRVDVSYYVPEIGHAYTTDGPPHTTFSSSAPPLQGLSGLEILFHEASHSFADNMNDALFTECSEEKKDCGQLWHAVLFYTAGVETRRALPPAEQARFVPYAYEAGVYTRGDWPKYRVVLEKDWQKYLDGKIDFSVAIHSMVSDLQ
jgi:hypothetical protein